jgi:uncharacterized protein YegP (UPF0339 family)
MIFEVYPARRGLLQRKQWAWRLKAGNGRIIAVGGETFNNRRDCLASVQRIRDDAPSAPIKGID